MLTKTDHEIKALYLKILFLHHVGLARERKQESNLEGKSNKHTWSLVYGVLQFFPWYEYY